MLCDMITVKAGAIVVFDQFETLLVEISQRQRVAVEVIENAKLQKTPLSSPAPTALCHPERSRGAATQQRRLRLPLDYARGDRGER
jgi:hypothetical protein